MAGVGSAGYKNTISFLLEFAGKKESAIFLLVIFTMSIFDLAGIAIIFPYIQLVMDPEILTSRIAPVFGNLATHSRDQLLLAISLALVVAYLGKAYVQVLLTRYQHRHLANFTARLTDDTVERILSSRYALLQDIPGSEIAGVAYVNTVHATIVFRSLIQIANEVAFLALLGIVFLLVSPILALTVLALLGLSALALYVFVIRRTLMLGKSQSRVETARYRLLYSLISAFRDIKVMGLAASFDTKNRAVSREYADIAWRYNFNGALPLLLVELVVLVGVVGAVTVLIFLGLPMDKALPVIGVAAVAAVRTVPGFAKLMMSLNSFRFSSSFVERLMDVRERLDAYRHTRQEDNLTFRECVELRDIEFRYGDKCVLDGIRLEIGYGQSIGIVGPSGSGKTTLLDIVTGLQPATSGVFLCDGRVFNPFDSQSMERLIGYVPQQLTLLDESIAYNITFERNYDANRLRQVLRIANLEEFVGALADGVDSPVGENGLRLSGGQRQRIGIARALYREPAILVFDEATSALDAHTEKELSDEIARLRGKVTLLIVSHRLSTVVDCDRIYVLARGRVQDHGTHQELLTRCELYREMHALQSILD